MASHLLCSPVVGSSTLLSTYSSFLPPSCQPPPTFAFAAPCGHLARPPRATMKIHSSAAAGIVEFDFNDYMLQKVDAVHRALDTAASLNHPERIHEAMHYSFLVGGKRVHPVLYVASCELVGGRERHAMPFAVAIEMVQTMSLMHDDLPCMDDDDLHRPKPSNHCVFWRAHRRPRRRCPPRPHLRPPCRPHLLPCRHPHPPARIVHAVTELSRSIGPEGLVASQMVDIESSGLAVPVGLDRLEFIHLHKTAFLLEASVVMGAIVGRGSDDRIELLRRYARRIGFKK